MSVSDRAEAEKLLHSCRVLFGSRVDVGWDFLCHLQMSGLRSAFRERALLTHPDRAALHGEACSRPESFIAAREAYELLGDFLRARQARREPAKRGAPPPAAKGRRPYRGEGASGSPRRNPLPNRRLLIGEFLLYGGHIGWETLIKAIVWQRRQRPRLGEMASSRGWISPGQARAAARRKKPGVRMGEELVARGLLTGGQVRSLLWRQRCLQQPLGGYFAGRGLMAKARLEVLAGRCQRHNRAFIETFP